MDIAEIINLILKLFSNQNTKKNDAPQNSVSAQSTESFNSSFWQLPNYEQQNFQNNQFSKTQNLDEQPTNVSAIEKEQNNFSSLLSSLDIKTVVELITQIANIFQNIKKPTKQKEIQEIKPSYISNLSKID